MNSVWIGMGICVVVLCAWQQAMAEPVVKLNADFPGGNVRVVENAGQTVRIEPDARGGGTWFYWYFEAQATQPGRVQFVLPEETTGAGGPAIGLRGPAISLDQGDTWTYAGAEQVDGHAFSYDFAEAGQVVRFAVTIPYVQSNLDAFLGKHQDNAHLTRGVLTKSLKGRPVELLQIGKPGPGVTAVLLSARHHACESIASFALEGFLDAALADTPAGDEFRRKYVAYVVPIVDKDGVEEGDQGKNRKPHDHNRDYGDGSLYPEVDAIEQLADARDIRLQLDLHCPTLRTEDHQVMYFVGTKQTPANNERNVKEFARLIKEQLPPDSPHGPLVWLQNRTPMPSGSNCNRYFSFRDGAIMAATLEIPYAPAAPKAAMDATRARAIGQAMFQAWVKTQFLGPDAAQ